MKKIFTENQSNDTFLQLFLKANDMVERPLTVNLHSVDFYQFNDDVCVVQIYVNRGVAENLEKYFENGYEKGIRFDAKIKFKNDYTFYEFSPIELFIYLHELKVVDSYVPCNIIVASKNVKCIIDGKENSHRIYIANRERSHDIGTDIDAIISDCMRYQEEHRPKPLSPIEQLRLKQQKFKAVTEPTVNSGQNQPMTSDSREIFDPSSLKTSEGSKNYKADLENIIGLQNVKHDFEKMVAAREFYMQRPDAASHSHSLHMCFVGAPGTGKTTIARIVAGYLYDNKLIKENKFIEISGLDLLGNYIGQTAEKTRVIINYAKGGILFIDEAYAIVGSSYGQEAINTLLKEMEDSRGELVVIFAGYEHEMNEFLQMNEGFRSRINRFFRFENYTITELSKIFMKFLHSKNLLIQPDALREVLYILNSVCHGESFSNGRYVRNLIEKIEDAHVFNIRNRTSNDNINLISLEDVKSAIL